MPVRRKIVIAITERTLGGPFIWDGQVGEIIDGQGATTAEWDARYALVDEEFRFAVETIDWNRVLFVALGRHMTLHPNKRGQSSYGEDDDDGWPTYRHGVCGECMTAALLCDSTVPDWSKETP